MKSKLLPSILRTTAWSATVILGVAILFFWREAAISQPAEDAPDFPKSTLTIQRADGTKYPFDIEVASTPEQEAYGLMYRRSLPRDSGMLFLWPADQLVMMWMKNTYIPLDMLFVKHDGTVAKIITNAQPMDLTPLSSDGPVRAVIEMNAGEATRRGLKPGDKVLYSGFSGKP